MQCRICLGTEEYPRMITPCACRGSIAYIHTHCLEEYCSHYPDRMCRVCQTYMEHPSESANPLEWILLLSLGGCTFYSNFHPILQCILMVSFIMLAHYIGPRGLAIAIVLLAFSCIVSHPYIAIVLLSLGLCVNLALFIPVEYLILLVSNVVLTLQLAVVFLAAASTLNPLGNAVLTTAIFLAWATLLRVRYGLRF